MTAEPDVTVVPFGIAPGGLPVDRYTLTNGRAMEVQILTYGGIVRSITVPDRRGDVANVALGLRDLGTYVDRNP